MHFPYLICLVAPRGLLGSASRDAQPATWSATSNDSTDEKSPLSQGQSSHTSNVRTAVPAVVPLVLTTPTVPTVRPEVPVSKQELKSKYLTDNLINFKPALANSVTNKKKTTMIVTATSSTMVTASTPKQKTRREAADDDDRMNVSNTSEHTHSSSGSNSSNSIDQAEESTEKMADDAVKAVMASISDIRIPPTPQSHNLLNSNDSSCRKKKRVSFSADAPPVLSAQELNASALPASTSINIFQDSKRLVTIHQRQFMELSLLGKGGSSVVHRVISCEDGQLYALKRIQVAHTNDSEDMDMVFDSYANEIDLLKRLQGTSPYTIDLVDHVLCKDSYSISMLLEIGDIDLAKLLQQRMKAHQQQSVQATADVTAPYLDPLFARMVWKDMLCAVQHIHDHRIIHGDLKPANFVFVKGHLKLIDFGIAKRISNDTTNIYRDSQIGTVNYMAPEAIAPDSVVPIASVTGKLSKKQAKKSHQVTMKLGRASDIWSLGCILYQMIYTRPPFAALNTIQKLTAITNPNFPIHYPDHDDEAAVASIQLCLVRDPRQRVSIQGANGLLQQPYLTVVHPPDASASAAGGHKHSNQPPLQPEMVSVMIELMKQQALRTFAPAGKSSTAAASAMSTKIQGWFDQINGSEMLQQLQDWQNAQRHTNDDEETESMCDDDDGDDEETVQDGDGDVTETMKESPLSTAVPVPASGAVKMHKRPLTALQASASASATTTTTSSLSSYSSATATTVSMRKRPLQILEDPPHGKCIHSSNSSSRSAAIKNNSELATRATNDDEDTMSRMDEDGTSAPSSALAPSSSSVIIMHKKSTRIAAYTSDDKENNPALLPAAARLRSSSSAQVQNAHSDENSGHTILKKMKLSEREETGHHHNQFHVHSSSNTNTNSSADTNKRQKIVLVDTSNHNTLHHHHRGGGDTPQKTAIATTPASKTRKTQSATTSSSASSTASMSSSSTTTSASTSRAKSMSASFKEQILAQAHNLRDATSEAAQRRTAKWQRPATAVDGKEDLKTLMARKMEDMRKFMDIDEENVTATESIDLSGWVE